MKQTYNKSSLYEGKLPYYWTAYCEPGLRAEALYLDALFLNLSQSFWSPGSVFNELERIPWTTKSQFNYFWSANWLKSWITYSNLKIYNNPNVKSADFPSIQTNQSAENIGAIIGSLLLGIVKKNLKLNQQYKILEPSLWSSTTSLNSLNSVPGSVQ